MLTTKNPIRCQIPPQQGAAVGVVLSFGADLIPILNLDAALGSASKLGLSAATPMVGNSAGLLTTNKWLSS
jgi:hypothetical protein